MEVLGAYAIIVSETVIAISDEYNIFHNSRKNDFSSKYTAKKILLTELNHYSNRDGKISFVRCTHYAYL